LQSQSTNQKSFFKQSKTTNNLEKQCYYYDKPSHTTSNYKERAKNQVIGKYISPTFARIRNSPKPQTNATSNNETIQVVLLVTFDSHLNFYYPWYIVDSKATQHMTPQRKLYTHYKTMP